MKDIELDPVAIDRARLAHNAYMRDYRKKNPERIREHNLRYWAKRAARENNDEVNTNENDPGSPDM